MDSRDGIEKFVHPEDDSEEEEEEVEWE